MIDQAFAAPVFAAELSRHVFAAGSAGSCGIGSKVHFSFPVRASHARTSPLAGSARELSAIPEPVITRSPMIAGGDVCSYAGNSKGGMRSHERRSTPPLN